MATYKTSLLLQKTVVQFLALTGWLATVQNSTFRGPVPSSGLQQQLQRAAAAVVVVVAVVMVAAAAAGRMYRVHTCGQNTQAHKKELYKVHQQSSTQSNGLELIAAWDVDWLMVVAQVPMVPRLLALMMPLAFREWKSQYCSLSFGRGEQGGTGIQC